MVWFYGISTIIGYLMSNPFLYIQTAIFQTIQFNIIMQFISIWPIFKQLILAWVQFSLALVQFFVFTQLNEKKQLISNNSVERKHTVLFDPPIGPCQVPPPPGQSGPGSNGIDRYSTFPKTPALLKPHHQIV